MFQHLHEAILVRASPRDPRIRRLEAELQKFYYGNSMYYDCADNDKELFYGPIIEHLVDMEKSVKRTLRVLEIGAGRTKFLESVRNRYPNMRVEFYAHDINDTNIKYYQQRKMNFIIGGWEQIRRSLPFDFIFSTFVYEHVCDPQAFLETTTARLTQNGSFAVICPKYVVPGYVPPAIRWLPWWYKHVLTLALAVSNLLVKITRRPKFWICIRPSVLTRGWARDYDAVHMVSTADLRAWLGSRFDIRKVSAKRSSIKMRLLDQFTMLNVIAVRRRHDG